MNKLKRRSSGPRTFDRDKAIETAMRLFRKHGYEGVSIADLTTAIGIAPPSLYAAFGSKAGLYREALDLYAGLPGMFDGFDAARTLRDAVAGLLAEGIAAVTADERGCMVSVGLLTGAAEQQPLVGEVRARRAALMARLAEGLVRWLPPAEAERLARYLFAVQQGIAVQARDGASAAELAAIRDEVLHGLRDRDA